MRKIHTIFSKRSNDFDALVNEMLEKIKKDKGKVIDIKFCTDYNETDSYFNAMIIYEINKTNS